MGTRNAKSTRHVSDYDVATFISDHGFSHEAGRRNMDDGEYEVQLTPIGVPKNVPILNPSKKPACLVFAT